MVVCVESKFEEINYLLTLTLENLKSSWAACWNLNRDILEEFRFIWSGIFWGRFYFKKKWFSTFLFVSPFLKLKPFFYEWIFLLLLFLLFLVFVSLLKTVKRFGWIFVVGAFYKNIINWNGFFFIICVLFCYWKELFISDNKFVVVCRCVQQ